MPDYLVLVESSSLGSYNMLTAPNDAPRQKALIEAYNGRPLEQRALLGQWDAMLLIDFESETDCLAYCLATQVARHRVLALPAFSLEALQVAGERAAAASTLLDSESPST